MRIELPVLAAKTLMNVLLRAEKVLSVVVLFSLLSVLCILVITFFINKKINFIPEALAIMVLGKSCYKHLSCYSCNSHLSVQ